MADPKIYKGGGCLCRLYWCMVGGWLAMARPSSPIVLVRGVSKVWKICEKV